MSSDIRKQMKETKKLLDTLAEMYDKEHSQLEKEKLKVIIGHPQQKEK